jgi:hypothetical protein
MKIDEAVKLMKQNKFCMCEATRCKYRKQKDNDYIEYLKDDGTWEKSGLFINMLMADWVLLDDTLSDKIKEVFDCEARRMYCYKEKDVKILIQRIKGIGFFNAVADDTRHDIFVDIDKLTGPRFKVTKLLDK